MNRELGTRSIVQCILSIHEFLSSISSTVNERDMYGEKGKKCLLVL